MKRAIIAVDPLLPAPDAVASFEWLTRLARGLGSADPRKMDERRADLLADLLTGRLRNADQQLPAPVHPGKPLVQVVVPITALSGDTQEPGELVGYGPIPAELARKVAEHATWGRLLTDAKSGALLDYGTTCYTPPTRLAEFVKATSTAASPAAAARPGTAKSIT